MNKDNLVTLALLGGAGAMLYGAWTASQARMKSQDIPTNAKLLGFGGLAAVGAVALLAPEGAWSH